MSKEFLHVVCPTCQKSFVIKGSRLRRWTKDKLAKPDLAGPFCDYLCSSRFNIKKATAVRVNRNKK